MKRFFVALAILSILATPLVAQSPSNIYTHVAGSLWHAVDQTAMAQCYAQQANDVLFAAQICTYGANYVAGQQLSQMLDDFRNNNPEFFAQEMAKYGFVLEDGQ